MQKGVQTRRSAHIILCALKNNTDVFEEILNKHIIKYKYSSRDINLIQAVVLESIRYNNQVKTIVEKYSKKKVNTFASVFPTSDPKFVLVVMLDEPKVNKELVYHYRDGRNPYKGNWRNTAGWTTVWVTGQIMDKIGPILATKY